MIAALAWLATLSILVAYAVLGRTGRARPFHVANFLGALVLAPVNLAAGVPQQAVLTAAFGLVAGAALIRELA